MITIITVKRAIIVVISCDCCYYIIIVVFIYMFALLLILHDTDANHGPSPNQHRIRSETFFAHTHLSLYRRGVCSATTPCYRSYRSDIPTYSIIITACIAARAVIWLYARFLSASRELNRGTYPRITTYAYTRTHTRTHSYSHTYTYVLFHYVLQARPVVDEMR